MGRDRERQSRRVLFCITAVLATAPLTACGTTPSASAGASGSAPADLRLVVIGDSIPVNSPEDCPGCTGFVDRYAQAVEDATGRPVEVRNLAQHDNRTLPGLLDELDSFSPDLAAADVVVVGIAHNSIELNADQPCGAALVGDSPDWSAMTDECAVRSAEQARPRYEELFATIGELRAGKPTLLRTINRYNDWIGWSDASLTPDQERITADFVRRWNDVLCQAAEANGFGCADISTAFNGADGLRPSGDLLADDYTHPSDEGNAVIAEALSSLGFEPLAG